MPMFNVDHEAIARARAAWDKLMEDSCVKDLYEECKRRTPETHTFMMNGLDDRFFVHIVPKSEEGAVVEFERLSAVDALADALAYLKGPIR